MVKTTHCPDRQGWRDTAMCVTKRLSPCPAGPCRGNIPLLSAPLTKQNRGAVKPRSARRHVCVCAWVCVALCVHLSTWRQWSVTAWSLRPWRVMGREQASCSIWPHGRTLKEKENTEEKTRQYATCAVCLNRPSITAHPALTLPYLSYHEPTYTHTKWQGCIWHALALRGG